MEVGEEIVGNMTCSASMRTPFWIPTTRVGSHLPLQYSDGGRQVDWWGSVNHQPSSLLGEWSCFREIKAKMMEQDIWHPVLASTRAHKLAYINIPNVYHVCYTGLQTDRHTCTHRYEIMETSQFLKRIENYSVSPGVCGQWFFFVCWLVGQFFKTGFLCGS